MLRATSLLLSFLLISFATQQKGCDKSGGATSQPAATAASGETDPAALDRLVRQRVEDLRVSFESRMVRGVMREIDPVDFNAYTGFEDQMSALFDATAELRLFFRPASVQTKAAEGMNKPARAIVNVDAEMAYALKSNPTNQLRKRASLQMELVKSEAGWRFVRIEPRSFFTP